MAVFAWADQHGVMGLVIGMADGVSGGLGSTVRDAAFDDLNDVVNSCSWVFVAGEYAGQLLRGRAAFRRVGHCPSCRRCFDSLLARRLTRSR